MARSEGVPGWHGMRKDELIEALVRIGKRRKGGATKPSPIAPRPTRAQREATLRIDRFHREQADRKNVATGAQLKDRIVVMVRDPYWLHTFWEIRPQSVERARSALGQAWHTARPVLRLMRVMDDGSSASEREIAIHGGVSNWYIDVANPPSSYRVEIGYAASGVDFYCLSRSNCVTTPAPGSTEVLDRNWVDVAQNADRIYAMSGGYSADGASLELQEALEERLRRRLGRPSETRFGSGANPFPKEDTLRFAVDAELVVYGSTDPHTHVTVKGEPVAVGPDGSFAVKMHLPDRRQVIPVVAGTLDGVEQKTIILGVERNTKLLDSSSRDVGV